MDHEDDEIDVAMQSCPTEDNTTEQPQASMSLADQLERCGKWLNSIPRDDVLALRETPEYIEFLKAFDRLGDAHRRVISMNGSSMSMDMSVHPGGHHFHHLPRHRHLGVPDAVPPFPVNSLQQITDDVLLRILEFLESQSLIRMSLTCSRFRQLAYLSASQRTYEVANARQLNSVMQLLRAKEQIDGLGFGMQDSHVRVPILLLSRRVLVTNAGDPEVNGIYFCTGSNGNGFVFTKPRTPECRVKRSYDMFAGPPSPLPASTIPFPREAPTGAGDRAGAAMVGGQLPVDQSPSSRLESEVAQPGQLLRCIIAKRFSNETILWYLSKEIETPTPTGMQVTQEFSFWSKLMVIGDASPDICRYPSQSSILARHDEGWQALGRTRGTRPPTVELLDENE
eukprot:Nitzschia sp. Nitz4//scaffold2_size372955//339088//340345//NITZ4_000473-RA/size372955-snap-gene-0.53-mRNA-1//1//CDS//3329546928//1636//frame0